MDPAPPSSRFSWNSVPVAGSPAPRTPTPPIQRPAPARRDPVKPFTPCDAQRAQLIDDLTGEDLSLEELAQRHETSVEALSTFIMTDAAVPRALSAGVMRVKLAAVTALAKAVDLLSAMIVNYACEFRHDLVPPNPSTKQMMTLEHKRDNARRACALLHRIANLNLRTPTPTPTPNPTPTNPTATEKPMPQPALRMEPAPATVPDYSVVPALSAAPDASGSRSANMMPRRQNDFDGDDAAICVSPPDAECPMPVACAPPNARPVPPQPSIGVDPDLCEPPLHHAAQQHPVTHKPARQPVTAQAEEPGSVRSPRSIAAIPKPPPRSGGPPARPSPGLAS